jgi:hypothetical protein
MTWIWTVTFIASLLFLAPIPGDIIKKYLNFGLIAGFVLGLLTLYTFVVIFNVWYFPKGDFLTLNGLPILLALVWLPFEIFFAWTFTLDGHWPLAAILGFPILSILYHYFLLQNQLIIYNNWSLAYTFLYSLIIHVVLSLYLSSTIKQKT